MAQKGTGISISFASGFLAEILNTDLDMERPEIDTAHAGSTGARPAIPGSLWTVNWTVEIAWLPNVTPPFTGVAEAIVVTIPSSGTGGNSTWSFNGFMKGLSGTVPLEERDTQTVQIRGTTLPVVVA